MTINDAVVSRAEGKVYVAVTVGGTARNQDFSLDWMTEDGTATFGRDYMQQNAGRLTWAKSGEGTKYIEIPLSVAERAGESREFSVRLSAARCVNIANARALVTIAEFGECGVSGDVAFAQSSESEPFDINENIVNQPTFLNNTETIHYSGTWQAYDRDKAAMLRVSVESDNGARVLKETAADVTGSFDLDVAEFDVGYYQLKHEILDSDGNALATMTKGFSIVDWNAVNVHGGRLTQNETWGAGKVHVVFDQVFVPAEYTLFIEPGAIVKFFTGTGITIEEGGGALFADQIIFTHINDDTVGGDSLNDGYKTVPPMDAYSLNGNFTLGDVELRCITQSVALSGTIASSMTLSRGSTYKVSGALTIGRGGTLNIPPGTILKMEDGASIIVNSGGTLNANGTRAAPVFITSIRDDEHGGDTNKDGDATVPQPGDWVKIGVNDGVANFKFAHVLYSSKNSTTGAINMHGGRTSFCNSEIAHGLYDAVGVESGNFFMTNSVIRDCLLAFRHSAKDPIVNSVIYDCGRLTQGGGQTFVNCTFSRISETWEAFSFPCNTTYRNCCFWNEGGSALLGDQDAMTVCGENGNIWGDPCFVDAENSDFRIKSNSACIDAGDGESAPTTDYYGQPRVGVADIGISEFQLRGGSSDVDLQPNSLTVEGEAIPGHQIFVKWEIINAGSGTVTEPWRDSLMLVNSSGRSIALGDKMASNKVGGGGVVFCSGYFTVPAIAEGEWRVKLNVNSYHDVFEGTLTENNTMVASAPITISVAPTYVADGMVDGVLSGGLPKVLKLVFADGDENRMVRLRLPEGIRVRYGVGFMPSASSATGDILSAGNDVLFKVGDDASEVYIALEGEMTVEYKLSFESSDMQIVSASQTVLPCSGNVTFTVTGAGFEDIDGVSLTCGGERVDAETFSVVDAQTIVATVDCSKLTVGVASLCVSGESCDALLLNAFNVTVVEGKGHFWARLVVPESVRQGRKVTCYVEYGNDGNADIPCQVIQVKMEGDGRISKANSRKDMEFVQWIAAGPNSKAGIIPIGFRGRIQFVLLAGGKNHITLMTSFDESKHPEAWNSSEEYLMSLSASVNRLAILGCDISSFDLALEDAYRLENSAERYSAYGTIVNSQGTGVGGMTVCLCCDEFAKTCVSSVNGGIYFDDLTNGVYRIRTSGFSIKDGPDCIVVDGKDVTLPVFVVDDSVSARIYLTGGEVGARPLMAAYMLGESAYYEPIWKDSAVAEFYGMSNGCYRIIARTKSNKIGHSIIRVSGNCVETEIALEDGCIINGSVECVTEDNQAGVAILGANSGFFAVIPVGSDGTYSSDIIPPDEYYMSIIGMDLGYEEVPEVSVLAGQTETQDFIVRESDRGKIGKSTKKALRKGWGDSYGLLDVLPFELREELLRRITEGSDFLMDSAWPAYNSIEGVSSDPALDASDFYCEHNRRHAQRDYDAYYAFERLLDKMSALYEKTGESYYTGVWKDIEKSSKDFAAGCGRWLVSNAPVLSGLMTSAIDAADTATDLYIDDNLTLEDFLKANYLPETPQVLFARAKRVIDGFSLKLLTDLDACIQWEEDFTSVYDDIFKYKDIVDKAIAAARIHHGDLSPIVQKLQGLFGPASPLDIIKTRFDAIISFLKSHMNLLKAFRDSSEAAKRLGQDHWRIRDLLGEYDTQFFYVKVVLQDMKTYHPPCPYDDGGEYGPDEEKTPATPSSIDPNEMAGPKGIAKLQYINVGDYLEYTVYFENKSDATAAAQEVRITNPLSEYLDWNSFEVIETAFNNQVDLGLNGKTGGESEVVLTDTDYKVRSKVTFDKTKGIIDCYIRIVDESTDSTWPDDVYAGFLPPNDDTKCGEGHFTYRVKLREDAPAWETVINTASIVFDYNEAIETDPSWWNTVLIPLSMNDILNADNVYFNNDEVAPWDMDLDNSCAEDDRVSYRSGVIFNGEQTAISMPVKGPGTVSFWWRCSAEYTTVGDERVPLDYGYLVVDGADVGVAIYGWETEWTNLTYKVTGDGQHQISWVYCKNDEDTGDVGDDSLWVDGVVWESDWPSIAGDRDAEIVKHDDGSFEVQPSMVETNLCVKMPDSIEAKNVTVVVDVSVENFSLGGANAKIVRGGDDITPYLNVPAAGEGGWIAMSQVEVKQEIVDESMDAEKGAEFSLGSDSPMIMTAPTKKGLVYTLVEGEALDAMVDGDTTIGDGSQWTPNITVKGGTSGFYTIKVDK